MKRKLFGTLALAGLAALSLASCGGRDTLLFLNWGEYINEELLDAFEDKYNVNVQMDLGESNEIFYSKVKAGTTIYDVVCPSDYMVEKMYANNLLEELDFTKLPDIATDYRDGVNNIYTQMNTNLSQNLGSDYIDGTINKYAVPYLWGTWGIMYSTQKAGLEKAVTTSKNQWSSLFDRNSLPDGTKVAMYDSHQHAYFAACKYLSKTNDEFNNTVELSASNLEKIEKLVKTMNYDAWGTDTIKKDIVAGNIDVGFMWTGDFLYYYAEMAAKAAMKAYLAGDVTVDTVGDLLDTITDHTKTSDERVYTVGKNSYQVGFDFFIPDDTVAFCDNLVIPKDSSHKDLAYEFINFMCSYDKKTTTESWEEESPYYINTYYVDYDACSKTVYNNLVALKDDTEFTQEDADAFNPKDGDPYDSDLYGLFYDYVIGVAFDYYYPIDTQKGEILAMFNRKYVNKINTTFNNARV